MEWYYSPDGRTQQGPVSGEEFSALVEQGAIRAKTLVWREGMDDWEPYSRVEPEAASPAGFWIRLAAKLIDGLILLVCLAYAVGPLMEKILDVPEVTGAALDLTGLGWCLFYSVFFVGAFSATPGKMVLRLRIQRSDGEKVGFARALVRVLAEGVSAAVFFIGYVMAAFDPEKRALHDRLADTRVVWR